MYIRIQADGTLSLAEIDDMKSFAIVDESMGSNRFMLDQISESTGEEHYWIDAKSVIELSEKRGDLMWVESFWAMLKSSESFGYFDMAKNRVKAHVKTSNA
jgi:hypothetical protein